MTNKAYNAKKPRLRCVDLSLDRTETEDKEYPRKPESRYKGPKKYPLSIHSFEKGVEYEKKLVADIDRLFEEEMMFIHGGSPSWVEDVNKEITHSGESPLFIHRLLSARKSAQSQCSTSRAATSCGRKNVTGKDEIYYRPNSTHQYLTATHVKDQCLDEVNLKYGRPTRTTLLRARQRSNTPAVNAYEQRKEQQKRTEEMNNSSFLTAVREFAPAFRHDGESIHSFLTGARYNGAHCVDIRSLSLYGIYMPRTNPTKYFVNEVKQRILAETPSAPPESPRSDVDARLQATFRRRPMTAPNYGHRTKVPSPRKPTQAWDEGSQVADDNLQHGSGHKGFVKPYITPHGSSISLNLAGVKTDGISSGLLPSVQGVSLSKIGKFSHRDVIVSSYTSSLASPVHSQIKSNTKANDVKQTAFKKLPEKKAKPVLVDRSVKAPSVDTEGNVACRNILLESDNVIELAEADENHVNENEVNDNRVAVNEEVAGSTFVNKDCSEGNSQVITIPSDKDEEEDFMKADNTADEEWYHGGKNDGEGSVKECLLIDIDKPMIPNDIDTQVAENGNSDSIDAKPNVEHSEQGLIMNNGDNIETESNTEQDIVKDSISSNINSHVQEEQDSVEDHVFDIQITTKSSQIEDLNNSVEDCGNDNDIETKRESATDHVDDISNVINVTIDQS